MTKIQLPEMVKNNTNQLLGDHAGDSWHSLVELGPAALPHVIRDFEAQSKLLFESCSDSGCERIPNKGRPPVLCESIKVADGEIWKTALDGIISIGGEAAVNCLHEVSKTLNSEKRPWVDEAVSQITARAG